jgi:hypothetical protein
MPCCSLPFYRKYINKGYIFFQDQTSYLTKFLDYTLNDANVTTTLEFCVATMLHYCWKKNISTRVEQPLVT